MLFASSLQQILDTLPDAIAVGIVSIEGLVIETAVRGVDKRDQNGEFSDAALMLGRLTKNQGVLKIGTPLSMNAISGENSWMVRRFAEKYVLALRGRPHLNVSKASYVMRLILPDVAKYI